MFIWLNHQYFYCFQIQAFLREPKNIECDIGVTKRLQNSFRSFLYVQLLIQLILKLWQFCSVLRQSKARKRQIKLDLDWVSQRTEKNRHGCYKELPNNLLAIRKTYFLHYYHWVFSTLISWYFFYAKTLKIHYSRMTKKQNENLYALGRGRVCRPISYGDATPEVRTPYPIQLSLKL